jgi:transglutaminase-like putative cysteine protease/drug/metabolite transporter superfamily protein YnfA
MSVATLSAGSRPRSVRSSSTTVLAMVLLAATGWTVLSGGWIEASPSAVLVGIAGAVEAVVLAHGHMPRRLALLSTPLLLFATLLPTTLRTRPATPPGGILHLIGQYAGAATTGLLGNDAWQFNVSLSALLWVCGAWTAWFAVRERRGALATAPGWAVLAVTVINAPDATHVGLAATVTAVVAIMVIAAVHLERLNDSWLQRRVGVLPGTDGRFATAAAAGGVLIVLLALVLPPVTSTDVSGRLFGFGGSHGGSGAGTSPGGTGISSGTVRFSPSTIPGGALTLADAPVLTYRSSTLSGLYLQMATDGVFDAGNWLPDESALNNGDFAQEVVDPGAIPRDRSVADGGVGAQQQTVTASVSVSNDTSGVNVLPFPGEPEATTVAARASGLVQPGAGGQLLTVDTVTGVQQLAGSSFVVTATQSSATTAQLRSAGGTYPSFIARDGFLQLSEDSGGGAAVIRTLAAQWTRTTTNAYDAATAIESKLRDPKLFRYTLTPPQPPAGSGMWPVTYFLTTSHQGYCQYFATAMGAMLRAVGIPSRLVNGYGPGITPNSAAHGVDAESIWQVTSNDAHTWVEAYFPSYGWIPFEPTPPSIAGDYRPFGRNGAATPPPGPRGSASAAPTANPNQRNHPGPTTSLPGGGGPATLVTRGAIGAAAVLVPLALFAAWFLRPRTIRGIWRRIGLVGALAGVPRDGALTFEEYASLLSSALPRAPSKRRTAPAAALADIAALSDRALYGRDRPAGEDKTRIDTAWRRLASVLPSLGWRVLRRRRATP